MRLKLNLVQKTFALRSTGVGNG